MRLASIRWQLPLSYAALALLTALALGLVLLPTLRRYYTRQEQMYLRTNAEAMSLELAQMVQAELPTAALETQLKTFSFLSQARVRLLDAGGQVLADSGGPQLRRQIAAMSVKVEETTDRQLGLFWTEEITETIHLRPDEDKQYASFIYIEEASGPETSLLTRTMVITSAAGSQFFLQSPVGGPVTGTTGIQPNARFIKIRRDLPGPADFIVSMPAVQTPYGFGLNTGLNELSERRSEQVETYPVHDNDNHLLGYVELSQGPSYGQDIVERVALSWAAAGSLAVLLAAGAGWLISHRISRPLSVLTGVTTRMATGDLSARADIARPEELSRLAQSFNEMADRVEETVVTLRRFAADAAHQLHTPLTALRTNLELAADSASDLDPHVLLERAYTQVVRLDRLTNGLLDLSRLETGSIQPELRPVNLLALLQEMGEIFASRADQAGLSFNLELPPEPAIFVRGNEAQLRQALENLLDNAIKFTPEGGTISLGLRRLETGLEIWVVDTGIGIPPGDLPHLFGRFHRGRNAAAYPGSGLGLAIVKVIVEGHNGQVTVANTSQGARFTLRLPVSAE